MADAVLFDLDGTLLDTLEDLAQSMNAVLVGRGFPPHERDAYKLFVGDGLEMLVRRALPAARVDDEQVRGAMEAMLERYAEHWDRTTRPYPGIPELLDELTGRNLRLAVLSNKRHDFTCRLVKYILSQWRFDPVRGARDGVPKKPDPTAALAIADELGIRPSRWIYLGDTGIDMRTAGAAGMVSVGVTWGFRDRDELARAGAQHIIDRPEQALELLDRPLA